jgi:hypothetical protein
MRIDRHFAIAAIAAIILALSHDAGAEALLIASGEIIIGTLDPSVTEGVSLKDAAGVETRLKSQDIVRAEDSARGFVGEALEIVLKDGSVIRGSLVDYEEEIGFFIDISFGTLDLPPDQVRAVYLSSMRKTKDPPAMVLGCGLSLLLPAGTDQFGPSFAPYLAFQTKLPGLRGIYVGEELGLMIMDYRAAGDVRCLIADLSLGLTAKIVQMLERRKSIGILNPYVGLDGGIAFIRIIDDRPDAQNEFYGTMNGRLRATAGLEISPFDHFTIDLGAGACAIAQEGSPFWIISAKVAARYDF